MATVYTSAFWSSLCCGAPFWRVCFGGGTPDRFVCWECEEECEPARDQAPADMKAPRPFA
jgi:hypothetical protein